MKTFQLKLISILILALAMTANADLLKLSVNGNTTIEECTRYVDDIVWIDIYCTADYPFFPYECFVGIVDEQGNNSNVGEWTGNVIKIDEACGQPTAMLYDTWWWDATFITGNPDIPILCPHKHFDFEYRCKAIGNVVILLEDAAGDPIDSVMIHQVAPDLGDAPDSTNNYGVPMTTYPGSGVQANYPTIFNDGNDLNPRGPIHKQPLAVAYLGQGVSGELEADSGWDEDGFNNISPYYDPCNVADRDGSDDCIRVDEVSGLPETFDFNVTVVTPNVPLYVNFWFDWNHDGDWDDLLDFCGTPAPEWAVQNLQLLFSQAGLHTVKSPPFMPWFPMAEQNIWMRITLSEQPWTGSGSGGSGPVDGYQYGETEDYLIRIYPPPSCFPLYHPDYCEWLKANLPPCWCMKRQCHGDADNYTEYIKGKGYYFAHFKDIGLLLSGWNVREPPQGPGIKWPNTQICADFDHDAPEYVKGKGYYRVHFKDLNILLTNWNVREPPQGPGIEPNCLDVP